MTTDDHERDAHQRVQEALAAYVIHALDEDELAEANALVAEHLPGCQECAASARELEAAASLLALAAAPVEPPQTVWVRIRRQIRRPSDRRWVALAAGMVLAAGVVALVAWDVTLAGRMGRTEKRQAASAEVLTAVSHPSSKVVPLSMAAARRQSPGVAVAYVPGRAILYVFGTMPEPPQGRVYQLWLGSDGEYVGVATFVPDAGEVLLAISADPFGYDTLVITIEPAGGSRQPSQTHLAEASL